MLGVTISSELILLYQNLLNVIIVDLMHGHHTDLLLFKSRLAKKDRAALPFQQLQVLVWVTSVFLGCIWYQLVVNERELLMHREVDT